MGTFEDWSREELESALGQLKDWLERGAVIQRQTAGSEVIRKLSDGQLVGGLFIDFSKADPV
jgi:hypothetical protein